MITMRAYAKINLTLEVLGRRDDGYHDIASILQTVSLHDTLTFEEADDITLDCDRRELVTPHNLVLRAANLLRDTAGVSRGTEISLSKKIPIAAGLGGGSSDAAATLLALNILWGLELTREDLLPSPQGSVRTFRFSCTAGRVGCSDGVSASSPCLPPTSNGPSS